MVVDLVPVMAATLSQMIFFIMLTFSEKRHGMRALNGII